ncbi:hypothetical protein H5410_023320 [Solanum commersonii]|uniref:Uncharacterized protein n=1 Tax=Solanum commersonii TaxID=4109 RepID=A0A9J5ZIU6_SOLCO|nr:hypothetical protein H5410_023320 [Solanum commersonii]
MGINTFIFSISILLFLSLPRRIPVDAMASIHDFKVELSLEIMKSARAHRPHLRSTVSPHRPPFSEDFRRYPLHRTLGGSAASEPQLLVSKLTL